MKIHVHIGLFTTSNESIAVGSHPLRVKQIVLAASWKIGFISASLFVIVCNWLTDMASNQYNNLEASINISHCVLLINSQNH